MTEPGCHKLNKFYSDTIFGKNGWLWWFCVIACFVISRQIYDVFAALKVAYTPNHNIPPAVLLIIVLVLLILFLIGCLIAIYQGVVTLQQIKVSDSNSNYTGRFYHGRKIHFKKHEIVEILEVELNLSKYFKTPLGRNSKNYKVKLNNGKTFFLSGAMPKADEIISRLKSCD